MTYGVRQVDEIIKEFSRLACWLKTEKPELKVEDMEAGEIVDSVIRIYSEQKLRDE